MSWLHWNVLVICLGIEYLEKQTCILVWNVSGCGDRSDVCTVCLTNCSTRLKEGADTTSYYIYTYRYSVRALPINCTTTLASLWNSMPCPGNGRAFYSGAVPTVVTLPASEGASWHCRIRSALHFIHGGEQDGQYCKQPLFFPVLTILGLLSPFSWHTMHRKSHPCRSSLKSKIISIHSLPWIWLGRMPANGAECPDLDFPRGIDWINL